MYLLMTARYLGPYWVCLDGSVLFIQYPPLHFTPTTQQNKSNLSQILRRRYFQNEFNFLEDVGQGHLITKKEVLE